MAPDPRGEGLFQIAEDELPVGAWDQALEDCAGDSRRASHEGFRRLARRRPIPCVRRPSASSEAVSAAAPAGSMR